jgi:hypothetical protein
MPESTCLMSLLARATVGGLTAMAIDMWQDLVLTSPALMSWVWGKGDFLLVFGIPLYNGADSLYLFMKIKTVLEGTSSLRENRESYKAFDIGT